MNLSLEATGAASHPVAPAEDRWRRLFESSLPLPPNAESDLTGALSHVLRHPGNLVRARLCYGMCCAHRLDEERACRLAIAVEYFHTASLLFDDLPCMDNATTRRNAECCHVKFGQATAILAALSLINRAYALAWEGMSGLPEARRRIAARYLENCLGVAGLTNGQSRDLAYGQEPPSATRVLRVAMGKTVPLIRLTLVWPGLIAGAPAPQIRLWKQLAVWWGLSYQVLDDIKDIYAGTHDTGKTGLRDSTLRHPNLALIEGGSVSVRRVVRLLHLADEALHDLARLPGQWDFLLGLHDKLQGELTWCRKAVPVPRWSSQPIR